MNICHFSDPAIFSRLPMMPGVYWMIWSQTEYSEGPVKPKAIERLTGTDTWGILYIGCAGKLAERAGRGLVSLLLAAMLEWRWPDYGDRLLNVRLKVTGSTGRPDSLTSAASTSVQGSPVASTAQAKGPSLTAGRPSQSISRMVWSPEADMGSQGETANGSRRLNTSKNRWLWPGIGDSIAL